MAHQSDPVASHEPVLPVDEAALAAALPALLGRPVDVAEWPRLLAVLRATRDDARVLEALDVDFEGIEPEARPLVDVPPDAGPDAGAAA